MLNGIRKFENLHIVMWLLKDTCWVMMYRPIGMFMVLPTLGLAFFITWKMRQLREELFHNLAVCSWITANSVWMTGEFFFDDTWRMLAGCFFFLGLAFLGWFYLSKFIFKRSLH
jgi:hypothetical protein